MTDDAAQKQIKSLEWKIRCAREALGEGEELPPLSYSGGDVAVESDQIVVPLVTSRASARLLMDPAVATDLMEQIGSVLHARRSKAMQTVRSLHTRTGQDDQYGTGYCEQDGETWPCPTIVALQGEGNE